MLPLFISSSKHFLLTSVVNISICCFYCSVAKSCLTLWAYELQHTRLPVTSLFPGVCSNSYPLSWWCHSTISSSVSPFSSCLQSFPASESFPVSQLHFRWPKDWGFSFSISPSNKHSGLISFRINLFDLLAVQGTLKSPLQHHSSKVELATWVIQSMFTVSKIVLSPIKHENTSSKTNREFM